MTLRDGASGTAYALGEDASSDVEMFGRFLFPFFDLTKIDMDRLAKERGFSDIMDLTWFCQRPASGQRARGSCNPCQYTIREGMGHRVGWLGRAHYFLRVSVGRLVPGKVKRSLRPLLHAAR